MAGTFWKLSRFVENSFSLFAAPVWWANDEKCLVKTLGQSGPKATLELCSLVCFVLMMWPETEALDQSETLILEHLHCSVRWDTSSSSHCPACFASEENKHNLFYRALYNVVSLLILVTGWTNIWIPAQGVLFFWQLVLPGFPSMAKVDGAT